MMEFDAFLEKFIGCFDDGPEAPLSSDTDFHGLEGWSSMTELELLYMLDSVYGVTVQVADIRDSKTIGALFELVRRRSGALLYEW